MRWTGWVIGTLVIFLTGGFFLYPKTEMPFHNLREAQRYFAAAGYQCTSDCVNGQLGTGFLISRQSVAWSDVSCLCKIGNMGPQWQGKVWVTIHTPNWRLGAIPDDATASTWGELVAYGDQELLSELDNHLPS